jgi:hypothetical protein
MRLAFARSRGLNASAAASKQSSHPAVLQLPGAPIMTNVFAVVGEHRDDPDHLLVLGDDGSYYDYTLTTGQAEPTEPGADWSTDESLAAGASAALEFSNPEAA